MQSDFSVFNLGFFIFRQTFSTRPRVPMKKCFSLLCCVPPRSDAKWVVVSFRISVSFSPSFLWLVVQCWRSFTWRSPEAVGRWPAEVRDFCAFLRGGGGWNIEMGRRLQPCLRVCLHRKKQNLLVLSFLLFLHIGEREAAVTSSLIDSWNCCDARIEQFSVFTKTSS